MTIGRNVCDAAFSRVTPVICDRCCTNNTHCSAKQSSATVAAVRPSRMAESHVSHRHTRSRSTRGKSERKPHTPTYTPDSRSWVSAKGVRHEVERATQIQSPTLHADSATREPSQSVSLGSIDRGTKQECEHTVTTEQRLCFVGNPGARVS